MELITGALVSLIVEGVKRYAQTDEYKTLMVLFVVSLLGAGVYTYLATAGYWQTVASTLITASAFYGLIISRFKD